MSLSLLLPILAMTAMAGAPNPESIPAPDAQALAEAGAAVFVDIRRPDEWAMTGMPASAIGITMEDPRFTDKVSEALQGDLTRPLILICRSGARTLRALHVLRDSGFASVSHVGEGMIGSAHGPGWLARGLPLKTV